MQAIVKQKDYEYIIKCDHEIEYYKQELKKVNSKQSVRKQTL